jgi:hypothetical protein
VFLGQSAKELVDAAIIAIVSDGRLQAPQEFGMTDNIQDAASVRDESGQFNGVVTTSRLLSGSNQRFDVLRVRKNLELDVGNHSSGTEDPCSLLALDGISNDRCTLLEPELR